MKEKLSKLSKNELVDTLLEIYETGDDIACGIVETMTEKDDIKALKSGCIKELNSFKRKRSFVSYGYSHEFSNRIGNVLDRIERFILPANPGIAFELADRFVRSDGDILDGTDDSDGCIGGVISDFCILWLRAAAALTPPEGGWLPEVIEIAEGDNYGCRDSFLENINILLKEDEMRSLADYFYQKVLKLSSESDDRLNFPLLSARVDMGQVAFALKDPYLYEKSCRIGSESFNNLQMITVIRCYLHFHEYIHALQLIDETAWEGRSKYDSLLLKKEALVQLNDKENLKKVLFDIFIVQPSSDNLKEYTSVLNAKERSGFMKKALSGAAIDNNLHRGLKVLLDNDMSAQAESVLLDRMNELQEYHYETLLNLVKQFEPAGCTAAQICLYRALILDILNRGYSKAYTYAAGYYKKLYQLDAILKVYPDKLISFKKFDEKIHTEHKLKRSFWSKVDK